MYFIIIIRQDSFVLGCAVYFSVVIVDVADCVELRSYHRTI